MEEAPGRVSWTRLVDHSAEAMSDEAIDGMRVVLISGGAVALFGWCMVRLAYWMWPDKTP